MRFKFYLRLVCAIVLADGYLACGGRSPLGFDSSLGGEASVGGALGVGGVLAQGGHGVSRGGASAGGREPLASGGAPSSGGARSVGGQAGTSSVALGGAVSATGGSFALGGASGGLTAAGGSSTGGVPVCDVSVAVGDSVQKAIDVAPVPGVVCMSPGTYKESLTLRGGVNVFGTDAGVIVDGSIDANPTIQREVELSGFELTGPILGTAAVRLNLHRQQRDRLHQRPDLSAEQLAGDARGQCERTRRLLQVLVHRLRRRRLLTDADVAFDRRG